MHYFQINLGNFKWNSCRLRVFIGLYKYGVYGAASFIAIVTWSYLRKDMRKFTSVILYINIICIGQ